MKESKAKRKERIAAVLARLDEAYGTDVRCYLTHTDAWQLLVAVILSAQCTDARVNMVTPALFEAYPTPEALGQARLQDVEALIHSVGFYHNKAKNIIACSRTVAEQYGGVVPRDIEALTALPGVGRGSPVFRCVFAPGAFFSPPFGFPSPLPDRSPLAYPRPAPPL